MQKLAYRIRIKFYLQLNPSIKNDYIPQLYIKLKGWDPPPATLSVEDAITLFEKQLKMATQHNTTQHNMLNLQNKSSNLTHTQLHTLSLLKNEKIYRFCRHANG